MLHCRNVALFAAMPTPDVNACEPAPEKGATPATDVTPPAPGTPREIGGRAGPEPTRFGDWERAGRCIDF